MNKSGKFLILLTALLLCSCDNNFLDLPQSDAPNLDILEISAANCESTSEYLSMHTISNPAEVIAEGAEVSISACSDIYSVGNSIILVGELRENNATVSRIAVRYCKDTLTEVKRMEIPLSECYPGAAGEYFVLMYNDRVEYYDEYLNLSEIVTIPTKSLYYDTAVNTVIFGTYEPALVSSDCIAFTTGSLHILNLTTGEEITVSEYGDSSLDVRQIMTTDAEECFGIMAYLYSDESDRYISLDENRYYICIESSSGDILDAVCSADLKKDGEFIVSSNMQRYHVNENISVSYDWVKIGYTDLVEDGILELTSNVSDGFVVLDAVSGNYVRYSDNSGKHMRVHNTVRDYENTYLIAYGIHTEDSSDNQDKVYLIRY